VTRIVQDEHTCFGKPRLEGTRFPTITLWSAYREGMTIEEMIGPDYWPHLTREQVEVALQFERSIREPCGKVRDRAAYKLKKGRRLAPSDGVVWTQEDVDAAVREVTARLEAKG
jgi:uncharacterized protein (DUF433 family)